MEALKRLWLVIAALFVVGIALARPASVTPKLVSDVPANTRAPEFELKDQHDKTFQFRFPQARPTILTFGDRQGSEQIESWVRPLYQRYQERIEQRGVAVLDAVPSLMRSIVRGLFKRKAKFPVLLDWKGDVARAYSYQAKKANLVLIDRQGSIVYRTAGPANESGLQQLYAQIDRLLAEGGQ